MRSNQTDKIINNLREAKKNYNFIKTSQPNMPTFIMLQDMIGEILYQIDPTTQKIIKITYEGIISEFDLQTGNIIKITSPTEEIKEFDPQTNSLIKTTFPNGEIQEFDLQTGNIIKITSPTEEIKEFDPQTKNIIKITYPYGFREFDPYTGKYTYSGVTPSLPSLPATPSAPLTSTSPNAQILKINNQSDSYLNNDSLLLSGKLVDAALFPYYRLTTKNLELRLTKAYQQYNQNSNQIVTATN